MRSRETASPTDEQRNINMLLLNILLVEDNPADVYLTRLALQEAQLYKELHVVEHGEQALAFLRQQERYAGVVRPDLIILDLNLPEMGGLDVLRAVKADPLLCTIPVIIFSTSCAEQDINQAYQLGATQYFVKPNDLHDCLNFGHTVAQRWQRLTKMSI